jgi:hypothetical protein
MRNTHDLAVEALADLLCFALRARGRLVQISESDPKLIADAPAITSGEFADPGLRATALLGDLHLREAPRREV